MRKVALLATCLLPVACTAMLRPVSEVPSPNYAELSFRDAGGKEIGKWDGIWYIDGTEFQKPRTHVYVARGRRVVGYQCPGWISVDGYVGLEYTFIGGQSYEMVCEAKGPVIHSLP